MHLYIHKIQVTVVTPECSTDAIERKIEDTIGDRMTTVTAETDRENRMRSPSITVIDPPTWPATGDKADEVKYFSDFDRWKDEQFPRADSAAVRERA